jgi:hypothetical protein
MLTTDEIDTCCTLLFGKETKLTRDFTEKLNSETLHRAYRIQVRKSHPDRAAILMRNHRELQEEFITIDRAYRKLMKEIHRKTMVSPVKKKSTNAGKRPASSVEIPLLPLPVGQYLLYRGIIDLSHLLASIAWQREARPPVGMVAVDLGYILPKDIMAIIHQKKPRERFCETAVRIGQLNSLQQRAIVSHQRNLQPKLGTYFLREKLISKGELHRLIAELEEHNLRAGKKLRRV